MFLKTGLWIKFDGLKRGRVEEGKNISPLFPPFLHRFSLGVAQGRLSKVQFA